MTKLCSRLEGRSSWRVRVIFNWPKIAFPSFYLWNPGPFFGWNSARVCGCVHLRLSASSLQLSAPHSTLNPNLPLRNIRQSFLSFIFVVNQIIYYYQRRQETACLDNRVSFISIFAWDWELGLGLGRAGERKKFNRREKKSLSILGDSKEVCCYKKIDRIPMWPLMECDC